ncbi:complement C1q subcomponent subunit A-like [Saccostrea echinata]|uniref:complement C1q subcomponent subunit A-like n=1 Tax=Saccostrea echinata TaxID=191078 RepID=UPI002A82559C|nr:complement C1q subcomponent subunit A-like [Saccostrea echinata]
MTSGGVADHSDNSGQFILTLGERVNALEIELTSLKSKLNDKNAVRKCECINPVLEKDPLAKNVMDDTNRHKRFLTVPTSTDGDKVAFYGYVSGDELASGRQHIVDFDVIQTNIGNGFHTLSGMFIAPHPGLYVFTWVIQSTWTGIVYTQLMRNSEVVGEVVSDSTHTNEFHSATGIVVTQLNQGDEVYVRRNPNQPSSGHIISRDGYRSSFSGWKI